MIDKELLEYAAKAAGINLVDSYWDKDLNGVWLHEGLTFWSPLTDDGDALRLAAKLGLLHIDELIVQYSNKTFDAVVNGDMNKAARLAITLAAAGVGEAKP